MTGIVCASFFSAFFLGLDKSVSFPVQDCGSLIVASNGRPALAPALKLAALILSLLIPARG